MRPYEYKQTGKGQKETLRARYADSREITGDSSRLAECLTPILAEHHQEQPMSTGPGVALENYQVWPHSKEGEAKPFQV